MKATIAHPYIHIHTYIKS